MRSNPNPFLVLTISDGQWESSSPGRGSPKDQSSTIFALGDAKATFLGSRQNPSQSQRANFLSAMCRRGIGNFLNSTFDLFQVQLSPDKTIESDNSMQLHRSGELALVIWDSYLRVFDRPRQRNVASNSSATTTKRLSRIAFYARIVS